MKSLMRRCGRFGLVGIMGAALQVALVSLLSRWFGVAAATPVAVEIAILHNFAWHECFTWRDRSYKGIQHVASGLWRFHAGNGAISLCGNTALVPVFVSRLGVPVGFASIAAISICSLANFLVADRWIFANRRGTG